MDTNISIGVDLALDATVRCVTNRCGATRRRQSIPICKDKRMAQECGWAFGSREVEQEINRDAEGEVLVWADKACGSTNVHHNERTEVFECGAATFPLLNRPGGRGSERDDKKGTIRKIREEYGLHRVHG